MLELLVVFNKRFLPLVFMMSFILYWRRRYFSNCKTCDVTKQVYIYLDKPPKKNQHAKKYPMFQKKFIKSQEIYTIECYVTVIYNEIN